MKSFDITTILGLLFSIIVVYIAIYMGGNVLGFIDIRSLLIVILGTIFITSACFTWNDLKNLPKIIRRAITYKSVNIHNLVTTTIKISQFSRNNGILPLEGKLNSLSKYRFFQKGIQMLIDGFTGEEIHRLISIDINSMTERHQRSVEIVKKAAETAPSMGLIGTLIGLVQMLSNLNDPSSIGPSMAIALLTTLYGAIIAFMICSPIYSKLEHTAKEEKLVAEISLHGLLSISRKENPRQLELLLNGMLSSDKQITYFKQ